MSTVRVRIRCINGGVGPYGNIVTYIVVITMLYNSHHDLNRYVVTVKDVQMLWRIILTTQVNSRSPRSLISDPQNLSPLFLFIYFTLNTPRII